MSKKIFSILIVCTACFIGCDEKVMEANKQVADTAKVAVIKNGKKLSCCAGPPSRVKIKVAKK